MKDVFKSSNTAGAGNVQYFQQDRDLYSNVHCEPSGHPCSQDKQAGMVIGDILWCPGCFMTTGLLKDSMFLELNLVLSKLLGLMYLWRPQTPTGVTVNHLSVSSVMAVH